MLKAVAFMVGTMLAAPALTATPPPPTMPNPFADRLAALSPADRAGALRRAVTEENMRCGRLAANAFVGPWGNLRVWQVRCVPGGEYGVFVGPDGTTQTRRCVDLVGVAVRQCGTLPAG